MSPLGTIRRYLEERVTSTFRGYYGSRFTFALGNVFDQAYQMLMDAWRAPLHARTDGPAYDALRLVGNELNIPQMAREDWLTYRNRIQFPWNTWQLAGTELGLETQLTQSIFTDAQVIRYFGNGSDSEFIVFFPEGSHPVTAPPDAYGAAGNYGDANKFYGPEGLDTEEIESLRVMIKHWKPATWKCPFVVFEISGETYGTGHIYGEAGLVYGGEQGRTEIQF